MTPPRRSRSTEAFFGRRHGKTLRPRLAAALETTLAGLRIDLERPAPADLRQLFDAKVGPVRLEIGFGSGEHLLSRLTAEPEAGFIGVEPFVNGMARLLADVADAPPDNLALYDDDATRLLDWLPVSSLAAVDLLYPDPWPKKRHHKRRFVNQRNLDRLARVLSPGGCFRFASDIDDYVNWTLLLIEAHDAFDWKAHGPDDWRTPYPGWPGTRYEAKALRESRKPAYLTFMRRD